MYLTENQKKVCSLIENFNVSSETLANFQSILPTLNDDICNFLCNLINAPNAENYPTFVINYIKLYALAANQYSSVCSSYNDIDECYNYLVKFLTASKNDSNSATIGSKIINCQDLRKQCRKNIFAQTGIAPITASAGEFEHTEPLNKEIFIPANVLKIESDTYKFIHWSTLRFENRNEKIQICEGVFAQQANSTQKSQQIINLTQKIDHRAFKPYGHVTKVVLGDISTLEASMFAGYSELEELINTEQLNSIEDYAFECCESLKRLDLPNVTSIGKCVFRNCSPELKIYTKADKIPLFANAFMDSFENHKNQFIV